MDESESFGSTFNKPKKQAKKETVDFTEKIKAPSVMGVKDIRASGVCGTCRKRYTAVPVINGSPQCPNCNKV